MDLSSTKLVKHNYYDTTKSSYESRLFKIDFEVNQLEPAWPITSKQPFSWIQTNPKMINENMIKPVQPVGLFSGQEAPSDPRRANRNFNNYNRSSSKHHVPPFHPRHPPPPQPGVVGLRLPVSGGPCMPVSHPIPFGMQPPPGLPVGPTGMPLPRWFPDTSKPLPPVSQDHLNPSSSQPIMPTSTAKRRLQDLVLPTPKRTKSTLGSQDFHTSHPLITDTNTSSIARMILNRLTERAFNKKRSGKSRDLLNINNPTTRKVTVSRNVPASQNVINNASNTGNRIRRYFKCQFCWRRYKFQSLLNRHRQSAHQIQKKAPQFCANCNCSFLENTGRGPWNECCILNIRKYTMQRYIK